MCSAARLCASLQPHPEPPLNAYIQCPRELRRMPRDPPDPRLSSLPVSRGVNFGRSLTAEPIKHCQPARKGGSSALRECHLQDGRCKGGIRGGVGGSVTASHAGRVRWGEGYMPR